VDVYAQELDKPDQRRPIIHAMDNRFSVVNHEGSLHPTDNAAPNYRVVKISINDPAPDHWKTILPEGKDMISGTRSSAGNFLSCPHDVMTKTRIFTLDGRQAGDRLSRARLRHQRAGSRRLEQRLLAQSRSTFRRRFIITMRPRKD
jgi:hypothetical protein